MPKIVVNKDRCKSCKLCIVSCPKKILGLSQDLNAQGERYCVQLDESKCTGCAFCAMMCPDWLIEVYK